MMPPAVQALVEALAWLRREQARCERRIAKLEAQRDQLEDKAQAPEPEATTLTEQGAGWTPSKRQAVSQRMRAYWAEQRAQRAQAQAQGQTAKAPQRFVLEQQASTGRSTRGWTADARAEAARRMQQRWAERQRNKSTSNGDGGREDGANQQEFNPVAPL